MVHVASCLRYTSAVRACLPCPQVQEAMLAGESVPVSNNT